MDLSNLGVYFQNTAALAGLVITIVSALKNQFNLKGRIPFIFSILLGVALGGAANLAGLLQTSLPESLIFGLMAGLFASGTYDVSSPAGKALIAFGDWLRTRQTVTVMQMQNTPTALLEKPGAILPGQPGLKVSSFLPNIDIKSLIPDSVIAIIKLMFPGLAAHNGVVSAFQGIQSLIAMVPPPKQLKAIDELTPEIMQLSVIINRSFGAFSDKDQEEIAAAIQSAHKKLTNGGYLTVRGVE